jgi:RES domain-containing protein
MPPPERGQAVWRITSSRYARRAFDGEGARLYGGRWNHPGVAIVYCSATLSLAALEYFVHLQPDLASNLVSVAAELPRDLSQESLRIEDLPASWRSYPAPERLKELGTAWARANRTAVLLVPSAVIPHEQNVLINPGHSDFPRIRPRKAQPFSFDPRMWK